MTYDIEAHYTSEANYEPARVHVVRDDTKPEPARRKFRNVTSKTYLASTTPELILPRSAGRRCATITILGIVGTAGNVVLADNEADAQAANTYSLGGNISGPGAVAQPGMFLKFYHNDEVWLARFGSAGTAPLVGVIAEYEA